MLTIKIILASCYDPIHCFGYIENIYEVKEDCKCVQRTKEMKNKLKKIMGEIGHKVEDRYSI